MKTGLETALAKGFLSSTLFPIAVLRGVKELFPLALSYKIVPPTLETLSCYILFAKLARAVSPAARENRAATDNRLRAFGDKLDSLTDIPQKLSPEDRTLVKEMVRFFQKLFEEGETKYADSYYRCFDDDAFDPISGSI